MHEIDNVTFRRKLGLTVLKTNINKQRKSLWKTTLFKFFALPFIERVSVQVFILTQAQNWHGTRNSVVHGTNIWSVEHPYNFWQGCLLLTVTPSVCSVYTRKLYRALPKKHENGAKISECRTRFSYNCKEGFSFTAYRL